VTATLAPASAPEALARFLDATRILVDAELTRRLAPPADDPGRLREAMRYAATSPGKRLRPALVFAAAESCGATVHRDGELAPPAEVLAAAIAIEMLHAYTLVHDDLPAMDDDDERRGRPTVHIAFGEAIAILAGDGLLTEAFGALAELGPRAADAVRVLARRAGGDELLAGQAIDLAAAGKVPGTAEGPPGTLAAIERMHAAKTGALFAAAAELGAIAAGANRARCDDMARYGMAIGIAFQHADDRDDADLVEHAAAAAERMRTLCAEASTIADRIGNTALLLRSVADWIRSRA
jgi:geranylgeranyl pyrophosphate synthase